MIFLPLNYFDIMRNLFDYAPSMPFNNYSLLFTLVYYLEQEFYYMDVNWIERKLFFYFFGIRGSFCSFCFSSLTEEIL